jgi:hypothetical protein
MPANQPVDDSSDQSPSRGTLLTLVHRYKIVIIVVAVIIALTLLTGGSFRGKVPSQSGGAPQAGPLTLSAPRSWTG